MSTSIIIKNSAGQTMCNGKWTKHIATAYATVRGAERALTRYQALYPQAWMHGAKVVIRIYDEDTGNTEERWAT